MSKKFSDELISAYLDGELTADEQAEVERALLDSAEHRRTFEELRALRQSLQSLPRFQLDKDFSQRVLRRAERAMLAGGDTRPVDDPPPATTHAPAPAALAKPALSSPATPSSELIRQAAELKRWRRISWASVSVAAASLFVAAMVALRGGQTHNIALTDSMRRYEGAVNFSAPDSVSSPASTATEGTGSGGLAAEDKVLDDDT